MKSFLACLLMLIALAHGEDGPSDAAVTHLERLSSGHFNLVKDTALADGTTREKKEIIRKFNKRVAADVNQGELRAIAEKVDGKLAAVMVSCMVDYDPTRLQVHAVGLLKRGDNWLPAPMLSSFENTGITYLPGLSDSAKALEIWMLRERTTQLARLRENVQADLLSDVRKARSIDALQKSPPEQIVERFIEACRSGDQPAVLAYLGGLEDTLPQDWDDLLRFVSKSLRNPAKPTEAWLSLIDTTGARTVVESEIHDDGATVSIGEFSPFRSHSNMPSIRILHFPLERNEAGIFRVILPSWLLNNEPPGKPDPTDLGLVEKLPLKLIREHPPLEFDNSTMLMESFQKAISGDSFEAMLPHMAPSKDPASVLDQAALLWRDFRSRKSETPLLLDVHQQGDDACALFSLFDARNPSIRKTLIQPVFSHRKNGTWALSTAADEPTAQTHPELMAWVEKASELNETEWLSQLGLTEFIEDIPADSAPTEEDARTAAEAWLSAIHSGDPRAILRTVAGFDDHRGSRKLLRAIGYELQVDRKTEILKIHRNGRWAAASTRTITTPPSDDAYLLLYPIVSTPDGPRILAEASLFHANTRSREFLNSAIWSRLSDRLSETATEELKQIEKAHAALAEAP